MKFSKGISSIICRRIPFTVALKHKHQACAALLNPSSPEPLVWPSPLKLIIELDPDAKVLLEKALMDANMQREKAILMEKFITPPCPLKSDAHIDAYDDNDLASEKQHCSTSCAEVKSNDFVDQEISPLKLKGLRTSNFNEENSSLKSLSALFGKLSEQNPGKYV
ncbi:putative E3 ubiquitin-protein ligase XBAT31, partial [Cucurbita argyrosperma subsp. sororia]